MKKKYIRPALALIVGLLSFYILTQALWPVTGFLRHTQTPISLFNQLFNLAIHAGLFFLSCVVVSYVTKTERPLVFAALAVLCGVYLSLLLLLRIKGGLITVILSPVVLFIVALYAPSHAPYFFDKLRLIAKEIED